MLQITPYTCGRSEGSLSRTYDLPARKTADGVVV